MRFRFFEKSKESQDVRNRKAYLRKSSHDPTYATRSKFLHKDNKKWSIVD